MGRHVEDMMVLLSKYEFVNAISTASFCGSNISGAAKPAKVAFVFLPSITELLRHCICPSNSHAAMCDGL